MLLALGAVQAKASYPPDWPYSTTAGLGGTSCIGLGASGAAGQLGPLSITLGGMALAGGALATSNVTNNWEWGHWVNKLMVQVKTDHDTWLVGGEMTPFLQALYREIEVRKSMLAPEGKIDEERLTEAIDRMMAMTEGSAP